MKIMLVADGRSAITQSWLAGLAGEDVDITLVSTFPCEKPREAKEMMVLPVAFSSLAGGQVKLAGQEQKKTGFRKVLSALRGLLQNLRYQIGPLTLPFYKRRYLDFVNTTQPDIVHALRIPFEGMLASYTPRKYPFIVSTWGNDLTLHARGSKRMARWTRRTLQRADGLMADATRDLELAGDWSFDAANPTLMVPGNGGLHLEYFKQMEAAQEREPQCFNPQQYQIINPRGFRPGSVHQDVFFQAIPAILQDIPGVQFFCPAMAGQPEAERKVHELGIAKHALLLPYLPQAELWHLYQHSDIYLSLSSHDGTPNTFLEAMACGCFPIVGNIRSLQEWIENGKNGLLVDPTDAKEVAKAVVDALQNKKMREEAKPLNWALLDERANRKKIRKKVVSFYSGLLVHPPKN
ncbi:MAG: glycosyltransferase family 4 protein [Pelolinea sp.]|jgi:glycosyltransferase involved in cell wall biosynthesis|nr:glycosyltransferase family 4 protein [Pelolinea sp.]